MARPARHARVRRLLLAAAGVAVAGSVWGGLAVAALPTPPIRTTTPRHEKDVVNLDVAKQQIKNYYGDPLGTGMIAPDGNYAQEARAVTDEASEYLAEQRRGTKAGAIVLDVDDTTLSTWQFKLSVNFTAVPALLNTYVSQQKFHPVPGMVDLVTAAERDGYAVFVVTSRSAAQEAATLGNLTSDGVGVDAGYPQPTLLPTGEDGLFTKPPVTAYHDYLKAACAGDPNGVCTTIHYKSATRAHIESLGYEIVANLGDQYSDLDGGHADRTFKLPNPTYFLP